MKCPKITIITVSYNQANYLEKTILSVINQNYPNLEYIVIDGASTDGSVEIIKKYEDRISYWISEKDAGQSEALNKGLRLANGDIVGWLNSDDIYYPNTLKTVARYFSTSPLPEVIAGHAQFIDREGKPIKDTYKAEDKTFDELTRFWVSWPLPQPSVFFRRSVIEDIGYINEEMHYAMDLDYFLRMRKTRELQIVDEILSGYRLHEQSKTGDWHSQRYLFWREARKIAKKYWGKPWEPRYWARRFTSALELWRAKKDYERTV